MSYRTEIELMPCPMKAETTPNTIELFVNRRNEGWKKVVGIKMSKNDVRCPWSLRFYEKGVACYHKYGTWEQVKERIYSDFFVELPDSLSEKLTAKIIMRKITS